MNVRGYYIVVGDKTECGGEVLEGDDRLSWMGMIHAREGHKVSCGKNGKIYEISGGISTFISNGRRAAGTLDSVSGCPCRAGLVPSVFTASYSMEVSSQPRANQTNAQATATQSQVATQPQAIQATAAVVPPIVPPNSPAFGRSFSIINSETLQPLVNRTFIATVDGHQMVGVTDTYGMAHVDAPAEGSALSIHVPFQSPTRVLTELTIEPIVGNNFKTQTQAQNLRSDRPFSPITVTVNDKAATREALIRQVRLLGNEFVERSEWKAKKPLHVLERDWDYSMVALHNAGRSYDCGNGAKQMLETQAPHWDKYDDISYHFGIDCAGIIYEGRDIRFKASSVKLYNTGVIGIVLLNNLTTPEEGNDGVSFWRNNILLQGLGRDSTNQIPKSQIDATVNLVTALKNIFTIKQFGGHKEYPGQLGDGKICPGRVGMELVKNIRTKTKLLKPPAPCKDC